MAGTALGLASALIGASWQIATRQSLSSGDDLWTPIDLAILRYGVPTILLAPWWLRWCASQVKRPTPLHLGPLAVAMIGAGLPFGLLAMHGAQRAPTAHMGVLMAGAAPPLAACLSWLLWRERPAPARLLGMVLMAVGVTSLGLEALRYANTATLAGDLLFLAAALAWACYMLSAPRTGLDAWTLAAVVNASAFAGLLVLLVLRGETPRLTQLPWSEIARAAWWQGTMAGVFGLWTITAAVARIGSTQAAAFGAAVPALAAVGGVLLLGEQLPPLDWLAVAATVMGVWLASRTDNKRHAAPDSS